MRIVFLTPNLPPRVCGLADHSRLLGAALVREGCDISLLGLRGEPAVTCHEGWTGKVATWDRTTTGLLQLLDGFAPDWLWVQLSGYGYSRWGAPWQLGRALQTVRHRHAKLRLAICVHEIHCQPHQLGPRGRLLSCWQQRTIGNIVQLGDLVFPTIPLWEQHCLHDYQADPARVCTLPIAANIPAIPMPTERRHELRRQLGFASDARIAVTFGTWSSQHLALKRLGCVVQTALSQGSLHHVIAIGGESHELPREIARFFANLPWAHKLLVLGPHSVEKVAEVLAISDFGLVPTPWEIWEKSGAARALEQARLTLWIWDKQSHRVHFPRQDLPTWDGLARTVLEWLEKRSQV